MALENLALRHQIEVLQRNSGRPHLRWRDRALWDLLSCVWPDWRQSLYISPRRLHSLQLAGNKDNPTYAKLK